MLRNKAFKYRLYPNRVQEELIQKTFGCVRYVYNHFLEERITAYKENGENRTFFQQNKSLTSLKQEHDWLKEPDKNALQCAIRDLNTAYQNFFRGCKTGTGFPKFKSKKNDRKSYSTAANGNLIRIERNGVKLPKLGIVKAKISREIREGSRILSATISQNGSGKYFVSILTEYETDIPEREIETALGLDYSSPHFYVDSEGNEADMPHFYRKWERRLAREQRRLSNSGLQLRRDALALLKEQEPRVLTVEEIRTGEIETLWIEVEGKPHIFPGIWYRRSKKDGIPAIDITLNTGIVRGTVVSYGYAWRCWTSRPTPEQMRETKWEGEGIK